MTKHEIQNVRFQHPLGASAMVEVLRLTELRKRALDHSLYASQRRDFHIFQVVTAGRGQHHFEFGLVRLRRGDIFHVRPGQVDWFDEASDHEALLLAFRPEAIPVQSVLRLRLTNPLRPSRENFARLEKLADLIEYFQSSVVMQASLLYLLQSFVCAVDCIHGEVVSTSRAATQTKLCEQFEALLEGHQNEHRSVRWYADQLGVSSKSLARACDAVFGRSPKQYIDGRVALQAKRLLVHTLDSVEAVAAQLGFSESTNFVKFFRRIEACTPQGFRDRFRQGRE